MKKLWISCLASLSLVCAPLWAQTPPAAESVQKAEAQVDEQTTLDMIDPDKPAKYIALSMKFQGCEGKTRFRVREGAMTLFQREGEEPLRFIVRRFGPQDVRINMVNLKKFVVNGKTLRSIRAGEEINLYDKQATTKLGAWGITEIEGPSNSLDLDPDDWGDWRDGHHGGGGATPNVCCTFIGCNGKAGKVCSTQGGVCGGDACGECCT